MSHKPGPWKCDNYGMVRTEDDQSQICDIRGSGCTDSEVAANARLIVAAPDLLRLLEQLVRSTMPTMDGHRYLPPASLIEEALNLVELLHAAPMAESNEENKCD